MSTRRSVLAAIAGGVTLAPKAVGAKRRHAKCHGRCPLTAESPVVCPAGPPAFTAMDNYCCAHADGISGWLLCCDAIRCVAKPDPLNGTANVNPLGGS